MRRSLAVLGILLAAWAVMLAVAASPVAAQAACLPDAEPNDQPTLATVQTGELCLEGTLAEGDQDLVAWEVGPADATTRWSFGLQGVEDALTTLHVLRVTSEPGIEPPTLDTGALVALQSGPDDREAIPRLDVLVPAGRYVLAVFRSGPQGAAPEPAIDYQVAIVRGSDLPAGLDVHEELHLVVVDENARGEHGGLQRNPSLAHALPPVQGKCRPAAVTGSRSPSIRTGQP